MIEYLCDNAQLGFLKNLGPGGVQPGNSVLITQAQPRRFFEAFSYALASGAETIALGHADWGPEQWAQFPFSPSAVLGETPSLEALPPYQAPSWGSPPWILIPTGGSSGQIKLAVHTFATLQASANAFLKQFAAHKENYTALCVLPLYHVSGFMQAMRASLCPGGRVIFLDFRRLRRGELPPISIKDCALSLVPRQLQLLLENPACGQWLRELGLLLVGGGPLPEALARQAQALGLIESYGLTEAAGTVAVRQSGQEGFFPLPHMDLELDSQKCLSLKSPACMHGYYGAQEPYAGQTQDRAQRLEGGGWEFLGRSGRSFTTVGGETLDPQPIERILLRSGLCLDVRVFLDAELRLCTEYVPSNPEVKPEQLQAYVHSHLGPAHCPKVWIFKKNLQRNRLGK